MAFWTLPHEELLRELWDKGYTGTEIAEELTEKIGPLPRQSPKKGPRTITRDMVIAKARRMGLESRPSPLIRGSSRLSHTA